ncbi:MAG TPA: hypothetical protein VIZ28_20345 [Chitinophagaceae bacterium]
MKKQIIILVIASLFFTYSSNAQSKVGEFSWQTSLPAGEFKDFIEKVNVLGLNFQGRWYLKNNRTSIGGSMSFFYFQDKKGKTTVEIPESGTFTGNITNFTNIYGLQAIIQQDLKPKGEKSVPFIRAGVGGAYQDQRTYTGIYEIKNDGVQFMANAEAGVRIGDRYKSIVLAATWHYLPAAGDMVNTSFFGIKLGICYFN